MLSATKCSRDYSVPEFTSDGKATLMTASRIAPYSGGDNDEDG